MSFSKEKRKVIFLLRKLLKYFRFKIINYIFSFYKKLCNFYLYCKNLIKNKKFFRDEVIRNKNFLLKIRQKFILEVKLILNKKFPDETLNIARKPIIIGMWSTILLFGCFLIWSFTAKIYSTAIAGGKIVVDSNKKIIQHFEGGIIEEIYIKSGDIVNVGDKIIRLSETSAKANKELLNKQIFALRAMKMRLTRERDNETSLDFSELAQEYNDDKEFLKILDGELELFTIRKKSLDEKIKILEQKKEQLKDEITGLKSQEIAVINRLEMLSEESASLDKLYKEGIISKSRYLELMKQRAELEGNKGQYAANISKVNQEISETNLAITNVKTEKLNEILKELQEVQTKIADLEERTSASDDVLHRTLITAPVSGIINNLKYHTKGGVIKGGDAIVEIIPQDEDLIVEVKINPQDIDVVTIGQVSKVRLSAYKTKEVPMLKGEVINVSADSFEDMQTGEAYFLARIKIYDEEISKLRNHVRLYPGMPVESYIVTGSRTFIEYLFDPITISMRRAFREE
jgi:HlyD family type I secretion membrane fusion protein